MDYTPERAAEIVDSLPVELRVPALAAVLEVSVSHLARMRRQNRVPHPSGPGAVWQTASIRDWLVERLVNRDADVVAGNNAATRARLYLGHSPGTPAKPPLFPFLGIY